MTLPLTILLWLAVVLVGFHVLAYALAVIVASVLVYYGVWDEVISGFWRAR